MDALLSGVKILDFTQLLPGPFATLVLADLGAEVLRVESHTRIDMARYVPPFVDEGCEISCMHAYLNRGKKSIALDLKRAESITIIERLIQEAGYDVLIEQFRPGVMDRLGLSCERLSSLNESLIYCSLTGYGQSGPLKDRAGHDINYLSKAGVMSYSGTRKAGPCIMGIQVADVGSGSNNAVIGILAAIIGRMKTGVGQHVDVAMTDGMFSYHAISGVRHLVDGQEPTYETELLNGGSLYGFYETADGQYLSFGGLEPQFLTAFLQTLGFGDYLDRLMEPGIMDEVRIRVKELIRSRTRASWEEVFQKVDACVEPVLSVSEAFASEHVQARELVVEVPGPDGRPVRQVAFPIRFSRYRPQYDAVGPGLGQDTAEILKSLGYQDQDIREMNTQGIIGIQEERID